MLINEKVSETLLLATCFNSMQPCIPNTHTQSVYIAFRILWKISQMKDECWLPLGATRAHYWFSHSITFTILKSIQSFGLHFLASASLPILSNNMWKCRKSDVFVCLLLVMALNKFRFMFRYLKKIKIHRSYNKVKAYAPKQLEKATKSVEASFNFHSMWIECTNMKYAHISLNKKNEIHIWY